MKNILKKMIPDRRRAVFTLVLGLIFSTLASWGAALGPDGWGSVDFFGKLPLILLLTPVWALAVSLVWTLLEKTDRAEGPERGFPARHPWIIPVILLIGWLPAFLADYPGGFRYDATAELAQVTEGLGFRGDYPLLHSAIVVLLLPAMHSLTGSWNTGVTVYVVIQMLLMAAMYTQILRTLIRKGVHRYIVRYALLYCAAFPVIQILVVQELRDVMFAALLTYTAFCLYLLCTDRERILGSRWKPAACALVMSLMLQSRNNNAGLPFLILAIAVNAAVWWKNRKDFFRGATIWAVSGIGSFLLIGGILALACQPLADGPTPASSMSVLSQSLARAYVTDGENWTEEEKETIAEYMDLEGMRYTPGYADDTKNRIRANAFRYAGFCLKMGLKYPSVYLDAVLAQTQKMWYPPSVIDGYKQYFTSPGDPYWDYDKNYFAIQPENEEPVEHLSLAPGILEYYTDIGLRISFEKIPVIRMFFSIGAQLWLTLGLFMYLWYRKKTKLLLPVGAMLLYMIGNAFVPVVLLRYFAGIFLCHPMVAAFLLQPGKAEAAQADIHGQPLMMEEKKV